MIKRYGASPEIGPQLYPQAGGLRGFVGSRRDFDHAFRPSPTPEYQLPGGGIDKGEHPIAALHREVMEETGYHIAGIRRLGGVSAFHLHAGIRPMGGKDLHRLSWPARCCASVRQPKPGHQAIWMQPEAGLRLLGNPGDRAMLALALRQLEFGAGPR